MFRRSIRIALASFALVAVAVPVVAFADSANAGQVDEKGEGKGDKAQFPMAADAFKQKVEARITKARQRLVDHMTKKGVDADKQKEHLDAFDAAAKQVRDAADAAGSDGTVTKEEAKGVRDLAKKLHHDAKAKHGKGKGKGKGKKGKKGSSDA
ncbi:MAG: hypothetical protein U0414_12515 [Polyangiaceae bacterium]